jgi:hypothetical protein
VCVCVCVCVCVSEQVSDSDVCRYICICIHECMHACIWQVYMHVYMNACMHACIWQVVPGQNRRQIPWLRLTIRSRSRHCCQPQRCPPPTPSAVRAIPRSPFAAAGAQSACLLTLQARTPAWGSVADGPAPLHSGWRPRLDFARTGLRATRRCLWSRSRQLQLRLQDSPPRCPPRRLHRPPFVPRDS